MSYGIATDKVKALERDIEDFRDVLTAPKASIAVRTAHTGAMRPLFNLADAKFESLDRVILRFGDTMEGRAVIAAYRSHGSCVNSAHGVGLVNLGQQAGSAQRLHPTRHDRARMRMNAKPLGGDFTKILTS